LFHKKYFGDKIKIFAFLKEKSVTDAELKGFYSKIGEHVNKMSHGYRDKAFLVNMTSDM
jgi:hypothetical protein